MPNCQSQTPAVFNYILAPRISAADLKLYYSMKYLTSIPPDILLKVLYVLEIGDILCLERTCTYLRNIISTRHLWLVKLDGLDQACAPVLPSHIDIDELSYSDLRGAAVRATRVYHSLAKDDFSSAAYELQVKVPIVCPATSDWVIKGIRLSPNGRYLIVIWKNYRLWRVNMLSSNLALVELHVFDLENEGEDRNVWGYRFKHGNFLLNMQLVFEFCNDGSIMLALCESELEGIGYINNFKLFRLSASGIQDDTVLQAELIIFVKQSPSWEYDIALSGELIVTYNADILLVMNWKTSQRAQFHMDSSQKLQNLKICLGYLFYIENTTNAVDDTTRSICALPIDEVLPIAEADPVEFEITKYEGISRLQLGLIEAERLLEDGNTQYLIHNWPRKHESREIMFSIIEMDSEEYPSNFSGGTRFGMNRAIFNPREAANSRWTLLKSERLIVRPEKIHISSITQNMTISGKIVAGSLATDKYLVMLDKDGDLHFPRIASTFEGLSAYLDEYSEALLVQREGAVEFYYPALVTT